MPETVKMIVVLTLISACASLGLAAFSEHTRPAIAENERMFTLRSINKVIPKASKPDPCEKVPPRFDNSPDQDAICIDGSIVYRGREGTDIVGVAIETIGDKAYSGTITCLVGLDMQGRVTGIEILKHAETPGLGAKIEECGWRSQLIGNAPGSIKWDVAKDGGDIDQLSGATISSRSVIDSVTKAMKIFSKNKDEILNAEALPLGEVCDAR
jgi:H+/Na+-translocating ferredoxin:NAD+ oxidoreductase subunit G